ncbi:hypothetical protein N665_0117s0007 [Sinapis alba]|nr:hypothetical protein N665_0117s0007 [Sinapis alba]
MPFGLCNVPSTFQRCMMSIFSNLIEDVVEVFMDDFSVYESSFSACLSNHCRVLQRCEDTNLVLNWEKCHFMVKEGIVLGHKISEKGIEADKAKIEVMVALPPPKTVKDIRSFLGHAGFYRKFIKDFSIITTPLTRLLCKEATFIFDVECLEVFKKLKGELISAPIVQPLDWDLPFEIMCDASDYAVGAVLGQKKDKKTHVIYYASQTLNVVHMKYATTENEMLTIVFAFEKFRSYLVGSKIEGGIPIDERLPEEQIMAIRAVVAVCKTGKKIEEVKANNEKGPWYADFVNYLVTGKEPLGLEGYAKKFYKDLKRYYWDDVEFEIGDLDRRSISMACSPMYACPVLQFDLLFIYGPEIRFWALWADFDTHPWAEISSIWAYVERNIPIRMSSPIRRCSLKGKAIATASDSDNSSSLRLLGLRAITLGGLIPRPTSADLAELNENERSVVQFSLDLEEREASGQVAVDDATQETVPSSQPENHPSKAKDKASTEKEISLHLADLLPMRWTGTDFEFDEEIDPEQEHRLSVKKNQRWENHFPTRSTFKSVRRLVMQTSPPAGFSFLIPADHQRSWTPPAGYACVYESWFTNCSLWWPLPEFLTTYCHQRRIALSQYTAKGIRILVMLTVLAAKLGITMSVCLFEELTTPNITAKAWYFYEKMVSKYNVITEKPSKVNFWNRVYFYVKINDVSFEDPSIILNGYFNANIDRLSKWSQGRTQSFLEEVEAITTLSHQHWPDISEARIQAALKRISRAAITSPSRSSRMGKVNLASLPSYADTIGTPVHEGGSPGTSRPAKRKRSATAEEEIRRSSPTQSPLTEGPTENVDDVGQLECPSKEEIIMISPFIPANTIAATEMPIEEHHASPQTVETRGEQPTELDLAGREEEVGYPHVVDFRYQHLSVPFVEENEAPARLFRQIQLKRRGMPELEQLSQSNRYREMTRAGAISFGSANLMVRDYEAKLKAQDEKIASKTGALKKKSREIAELAYKCDSYEEQIGALNAENIEAAERAEALSDESLMMGSFLSLIL